MHSFQKKMFQILPHFTSYVQKNPHRICTACIQDKRVFIQIWDIFCGACSQWKELALVMRKCLPFLIIDANSPIIKMQTSVKKIINTIIYYHKCNLLTHIRLGDEVLGLIKFIIQHWGETSGGGGGTTPGEK